MPGNALALWLNRRVRDATSSSSGSSLLLVTVLVIVLAHALALPSRGGDGARVSGR